MQLIWCLHASTNYISLTHCLQLSSAPCLGPHAAVSSAFGGRCIPCTHAKHNSNHPRMQSPPQMSAMGVGSLPDELLACCCRRGCCWCSGGPTPGPRWEQPLLLPATNAMLHHKSQTHLRKPCGSDVLVGAKRTSS